MNNIKVSNAQKITIERNGTSPYIDESGTWFQFDDSLDDFVDTGVYAKGEKGDTGATGPQGVQGKPFTISKVYSSIEEMNNDLGNMEDGNYVMIASSVEEEDNAKLFVKSNNEWVYITDFSGATGIQGEQGPAGPQGEPGRTTEYQPGEGIEVAEGNVLNIIKATSNTLGGVKVGDNLTIDENGVLKGIQNIPFLTDTPYLPDYLPANNGENVLLLVKGKFMYGSSSKKKTGGNDNYIYLIELQKGAYTDYMSIYDLTGHQLYKNQDIHGTSIKVTMVFTIIDALNVSQSQNPLSAKQGKVLNDKITDINNTIGDINSVLTTLVTVEEDA